MPLVYDYSTGQFRDTTPNQTLPTRPEDTMVGRAARGVGEFAPKKPKRGGGSGSRNKGESDEARRQREEQERIERERLEAERKRAEEEARKAEQARQQDIAKRSRPTEVIRQPSTQGIVSAVEQPKKTALDPYGDFNRFSSTVGANVKAGIDYTAKELGEGADSLFSFFTPRETKQPPLKAVESRTGRGATSEYIQTPIEELPPQQKFETKIQREQEKSAVTIVLAEDRLKEKVDSGQITVEEANRQLDEVVTREAQRVQVEIDKAEQQYTKEENIRNLPGTLVGSTALGLLGGLVPPVGAGLAIGFGASTYTQVQSGDLQRSFQADPYGTIALGGAGLVSGVIGGGVGSAVRTKLTAPTQVQIDSALQRTKIVQKSVATNAQGVIKQFDLPEGTQQYLRSIEDQGGSIRAIQYKLDKSRLRGKDREIIPDARANVIEVVSRDGNVIERIALDTIEVKTARGKVINRGAIEKTIGVIDGDVQKSVTRTVEGKWKNKEFQAARQIETYEETTSERTFKSGRAEAFRTQGTTSLISDSPLGGLMNVEQSLRSPLRNIRGNVEQQVKSTVKSREGKGKVTQNIDLAEVSLLQEVEMRKGSTLYGDIEIPDLLLSARETTSLSRGSVSPIEMKPPRSRKTKAPKAPSEPTSLIRLDEQVNTKGRQSQSLAQTPKELSLQEASTRPISSAGGAPSLLSEAVRTEARTVRGRKSATVGASSTAQDQEINSLEAPRMKQESSQSLASLNFEPLSDEQDLSMIQTPFDLLGNKSDTNNRSGQATRQGQSQKQGQQQQQDFMLDLSMAQPQMGRGGFDFTPRTPTATIPLTLLTPMASGEETYLTRADVGHDVYIRKEATKKGKARWEKINTFPLNEKDAKDILAYAVDNSISAQGEIRRAKGKAKDIEGEGITNYFDIFRDKFRDFQVSGGIKKPLKNRYIENRNSRLDTQGETNEITIAKIKSDVRSRIRQTSKRKRINSFNLSTGLDLL